MSFIQGIITEDFILIGSNKDDESPNHVFKPNKQIIIGCKEGLVNCAQLLDGYCIYDEETGFSALNQPIEISYSEFIAIIEERFAQLQQQHEDTSNNETYKINCIVCGHNGTEFEITIFTLGMEDTAPNGIIKAKKVSNLPYQGITLGQSAFSQMLHALVHEHYHTYKDLNLLRYKYIIQQVFEEGSKLDSSIKPDVHFNRIRKNDLK